MRCAAGCAARKAHLDCGIACLEPLSRRPSGYSPVSACRAVAQRAKAEPPQTGGLTSKKRAARSNVSRAEAERPLIRLIEHNTIETRFCVNRMITKTDPKPNGAGESQRTTHGEAPRSRRVFGFNCQRAVTVGQHVRGGGKGGGRSRLFVMMAIAMASNEARTSVPQRPAMRLGPSGAMRMPCRLRAK
jgi:hypothetical protein